MNWKKGKPDSYYNEKSPSFRNRDNAEQKVDSRYQNVQNLERSNDSGSGSGEMLYLDPTDENFRRSQAISPVTEGRQTLSRSPNQTSLGQSVIYAVRNDLNERQDTAQMMGKKPIPSLRVNLPMKSDTRMERSPKTINLGESEKEIEYNIKTLKARRSPKGNLMYQNEQGNIFLDLPMQSTTFIQGEQGTFNSPGEIIKGKQGEYSGNSRDNVYSMNPRETREPIPTILNKMSPNKNIDDDNNSENKMYDSQNQFKDLKRHMANPYDNDGMNEGSHPIKNDIEKVEEYIKNKEDRNQFTEGEIKKLVKQITHGYDPRKGKDGRLISTSQTIIPGGSDELFHDRYKVLQKMTRLSTILLSTNKGGGEGMYQSSVTEDKKKTFDRNTLNSSTINKDGRRTLKPTPKQKFLFISLAMLSSKGPNCEDRIILRKMRYEKGGVVDLAQDQTSKTKFQVKKIQRKIPPGGARQSIMYNPKFRDKAAKIVQAWWRDLKGRYEKILDKIVLIQSVWRGRWLRKYIYDIIYISYIHQRFCDIIEKTMVNHIRPQVWETLFGDTQGKLDCLARLLEKDERWSYLRLKPFFDRWRENASYLSNRNLKSRNLVNMKELNTEKYQSLRKYFNIWALRANLIKYIGIAKDAELQKKKFFGVLKMLNGMAVESKRVGLETVKPPIKKFLIDQLKSRAIRAILMKQPNFSLVLLRKYFNKWNTITLKMLMKQFRDQVFDKLTTHLNSRILRSALRSRFNQWKDSLPKDMDSRYARGRDLLEKFSFRTTYQDPLNALKEKTEYLNKKDHLQRLLGVKDRYIRHHWREYLYKWRMQAQKLKDKEIKNKLYNTLLNTQLLKRRNRILSNRFSQWRKTPKVDIEALFNKYKAMQRAIENQAKKALEPAKKEFLDRCSKSKSPKAFKLALQRLLERYLNRERFLLRHYVYKWREQCKNLEIYDLKVQLFKALCGMNDKKNRKGVLSRALNRWNLAVNKDKGLRSAKRNYRINNGLDKLCTLFRRNPIDLMRRLHQLMNKDYRPNYIMSLVNRLFKPRATVQDCFVKWRRVNEILKAEDKVKNLKAQILKTSASRLNSRLNRDSLLKSFFKWKNLCLAPEDYYPRIAKGIEKTDHTLKSKALRDPFAAIKGSKNYAKKIIPLLKNNKHLQDRLDKDSLRSRFNNWKFGVANDRIRDLKSNIILRTRNNMLLIAKGKVLSKYFMRWKLAKPKGFNADFYKGIELLRSYCEKPYRRPILNAFKLKIDDMLKRRGLNTLFSASKTFTNHVLHNVMVKWWMTSKLIDPNKAKRLQTRLRIYMKDKTQKPLDKYFKRWLRALVKNPNYVDIVNGTDRLKSAMVKKHRPAFRTIKEHISPAYINGKIMTQVLPNSKLAKKRSLKHYFDRWREKVNKIKVRALQGGLLSKVYTSGKGIFKNRVLKEHFDKWATKDPEKRPTDYHSVIKGYDKVHSTFINKYLKDFIPDIDNYGRKKFLRSLLFRTSKYHLKALKPYFDRWRKNSIRLQTKALTQDVSSRLMAQTKSYRNNEHYKNLLTDKLSQWRLNAKNMTKKRDAEIPIAVDTLNKSAIKKSGPTFIDGIKKKAFINKKQNSLKALPNKRAKCDKSNLRRYFNRFRGIANKIKFQDIEDKLLRNYLYHILKRREIGPLRYFMIWKNKAQKKVSDAPIAIGIDKLRLAALRGSSKTFFKRAQMINVPIPRGLGLKKALVNRQVNVAKSICLRNLSIRPSWNKWKRQANAIKNKSANRHIFNKIITNSLANGDLVQLRRASNQWKSQTNEMNKKEQMKQFQMRLLSKLYQKNGSVFIKRFFDKWRYNSNREADKLKTIDHGMNLLKAHVNKSVVNQMRNLITKQSKFERAKLMLINTLRNNDKGNLAYCFNKWKNNSNKLYQLNLKAILLRNLSNKQDQKSDDYKRNRLNEALLRWKINSTPRDLLQKLDKIRPGCDKLKAGLRKPHERQILDGIRDRANRRYANSLLYKLFSKLYPKFNQKILQNAFENWRSKLGDTNKLLNRLLKLFKDSLSTEPKRRALIKDPLQDLIDAMKAYDQLKKDKAQPIADFCRGLLNIKRQFNILRRNKLMYKQILGKDLSLLTKYNIMFKRWLRTARYVKSDDDAGVIQKFLKAKMNNPADKRKRIVRGGTLLDLYIKKVVMKKIANEGKTSLLRKILMRHIGNQGNLNNKSLHDAFNKWKNLMPLLRREEGARTIQNSYRNLRARRKVDQMRNLNTKMRYLILRLLSRYLDKRKTAFSKWLHETKAANCDKQATVIQKFTNMHLKRILKDKAIENLRDLFKKSFVRQLTTIIKKASKITGDKGAVMFNILEDIYIRRPFDKLTTGMKWISRIAMIKRIKPKILNALRNHFLPSTLRRWKAKTWDDKIRKVIRIQNWIRIRTIIWKAKAKQRQEDLLAKFLLKMTKDNEIKLAIPFKVWDKKTKLDKLSTQALTLQRIWKGSTSRKNVDRLLNKKKLNGLFGKAIFNQIKDAIDSADKYGAPLRKNLSALKSQLEQRYATNNLVDFANDALRNKYLYLLTGRRAFGDGLSNLRRYFDRWRRVTSISVDAIKKIQNAVRAKNARDNNRKQAQLKDRMLYLLMHLIDNDQVKLESAFRRWNLRARLAQCTEMSEVIQDYLTPRLEKLLTKKFQNLFTDLAKRLANRRLNQGAKVKRLKDVLTNISMRTFLQRLKNKDRANRIKFILAKKFHLLSDELLKLYLEKYFKHWRNQTSKLTDKLNKAALFIQTNFKGHLARLFLAKLKNRRAKLLWMLMKLINDRDVQKQVAFNLWRTNAQASKLEDSSKVLQNFMDDIKNKMELRRQRMREKRIAKGLELLCNMKELKREPFNKIKSEANRDKFNKMNDRLMAKRKDHLQAGLDSIKEREKYNLLNRLFKIPTGIRLKILRKALNQWKDNANKLGRKQAAELIQKNYRLYLQRLLQDGINKRIHDLLAHLALKYSDLLRYYYNKWKTTTQQSKVLRAGNKINRFLDKKFQEAKAKKNWNKLADLLNLHNRNYDALNLLRRLREFMACNHLIKPIEHRIKEEGFNHLLDQLRKRKLGDKLQLIFNNFERRKEILSLLHYLNHWRNQARKLKQRDEALEDALRAINNRRNIIGADTINAACLIKKLFNTIPKIRALDFFNTLRRIAEEKRRLKDLGDCLVKTRNEAIDNNKSVFAEKIYKVYVYRILNKMLFGGISSYINNTIKPRAQRDFISRLQSILYQNSNFNYTNNRKNTLKSAPTSLKFKAKVTNPKHVLLNTDNEQRTRILTPHLVDYLDGKLKHRKKDALDKIKGDFIANKFCNLYKTFSNKKMAPPKRELYDSLAKASEYNDTIGPIKLKLFKLLRRRYVRHVADGLAGPSRIYKLFYMVRITQMHKKLASQRFVREVIRKWRFGTFVKKMAKKKLELMYKNLHVAYLQMANDVFGDEDEVNPSVIKQFERFGSEVGMFSNEDAQVSEELVKKYYKTVSKKYVFDAEEEMEIKQGNTKWKDESEFGEEEEIEENPDFYIDDGDIGEGTTGKYKSETNKSRKKDKDISPFKKK